MSKFNAKNYWESRLGGHYDLQGVGYRSFGKLYNNWLYKIRKINFLRCMKSYRFNFKNLKVLDIGSGTGFFIDRWKELGVEKIVGSDITNIAITKLRKRYPNDHFLQLDIGSGDIIFLGKDKYDIISAFSVLFHIIDDNNFENAIRNIHDLLKLKGIFILEDVFAHSNGYKIKHFVCRTLIYYKKILTEVGFNIIYRRPLLFLMNIPSDSKARIIKKWWGFLTKIIEKGEMWGNIIGSILYPFELLFTNTLRESPTSELMICQKVF